MSNQVTLDNILFEQIFDAIPIGLFLIDKNHCIQAWNPWMSKNTNIEAQLAIGQKFESLYPDNISLRFTSALEQVLTYGHPQILSDILNKFIIPIPLDKKAYLDLGMMQQRVEILPVNYGEQNMALVIIQDVSAKTHLKNTLMSMASKFEKSSLIDTLTGLYNRRFLWKHLDSELKGAITEGYNVICCLYDLDYFKKINDEFGHIAGDETLISFAKHAQGYLQHNDLLFRYGGEEFISISTRVDINDAIVLPNRIRVNLESLTSHGTVNKTITCSVGVACWQPSDPIITAEKLVDKADISLYKAKKMGRNCIVIDGSVVTLPSS